MRKRSQDVTITRYGDVGTPERHKKLWGVKVVVIEGQNNARCIENYLDGFLEYGIFNQAQHGAVYRLIQDYSISCLYKYRTISDVASMGGIDEERREKARLAFNTAIKYNPEFIKLANIALLSIEQIGVHIPAPWRLKQLADRLIKYYQQA